MHVIHCQWGAQGILIIINFFRNHFDSRDKNKGKIIVFLSRAIPNGLEVNVVQRLERTNLMFFAKILHKAHPFITKKYLKQQERQVISFISQQLFCWAQAFKNVDVLVSELILVRTCVFVSACKAFKTHLYITYPNVFLLLLMYGQLPCYLHHYLFH